MTDRIDGGRRMLIGAAPLILMPGTALAQGRPERAKTTYTPEQNRALDAAMAGWPMVLHGPRKRPDVVIVTARRCGYCQLFHRSFPEPPRGKTFGYLVGTWSSDPSFASLPIYKEPTLAIFRAYLDGSLQPPGQPTEADRKLYFGVRDRVLAFHKLGYTGTPAILLRTRDGWHLRKGFSVAAGEWLRGQLSA